jgi:hypothetical protein
LSSLSYILINTLYFASKLYLPFALCFAFDLVFSLALSLPVDYLLAFRISLYFFAFSLRSCFGLLTPEGIKKCPLPHLFRNPCFFPCFLIIPQRFRIVVLIGLEYTNKSICPQNLFIFVVERFFFSFNFETNSL